MTEALTLESIVRPPNAQVYRCQFISPADADGFARVLVLDIPLVMVDEIRHMIKVGAE